MGGIEEALDVSPRAQAALETNADLLARTGIGSVPAMLFRADDGKAELIFGAPSRAELDAVLPHIDYPSSDRVDGRHTRGPRWRGLGGSRP